MAGVYQQFGGELSAFFSQFITVGGDVTLHGGTMLLAYGWGLTSSGALTVSGGELIAMDALANFNGAATIGAGGAGGMVQLVGGNLGANGVTVNATGVLTGAGVVGGLVVNAGEVDAGPIEDQGTLTITGSLTQTGGVTNISSDAPFHSELAVGGTFNENAGTVNLIGGGTLEGNLNILLAAVFNANGSVEGGVVNAGSINLLNGASLFMSTFTQNSTGVLTLDLIEGGSGCVTVGGVANLGGGLVLASSDGFAPAPGSDVAGFFIIPSTRVWTNVEAVHKLDLI